jgi:hypothetical protein
VRRPSRTIRIVKWLGTVLCIAIVVGWIAAQWQWFLFKTGTPLDLSCAAGYVLVDWWSYEEDDRSSYEAMDLPSRMSGSTRLGLGLPYLEANVFGVRCLVPFWTLLAAAGVPTALLWWLDRRNPPGHCQKCGYELAGNVSGICPECSTAVKRGKETA